MSHKKFGILHVAIIQPATSPTNEDKSETHKVQTKGSNMI